MDNKDIIKQLRILARLSEIHDVNPFKVRAMNNALFSLERAGKKLASCSPEELEKIDGVGKSTARQITELVTTGSCSELDNLLKKTPDGILEISRLPGLGAKKVKMLWNELSVDSLEKLGEVIDSGDLENVKGFGAKTVRNLDEALSFFLSQKGKMLYPDALLLAESLIQALQGAFPESRWEITGDLRRKCQVAKRIEILGERKKQKAMKFLKESDSIEFLPRESSPFILRGIFLDSQIPLWIRLADEDQFDTEWFRSTGPAEHTEPLLSRVPEPVSGEEIIYRAADLPFHPPEIRDAASADLSEDQIHRLVTTESIRGILHAHSTYSDGRNSLEEMAEAALENGYQYLGITDHSKSSFFYANGLFENRVREQHREIDAINERMQDRGFRIFKGIECDILPDGSLDYSDDILESFDFVICSVHSVLNMDAETATQRLLKAIENPFTTILGHLTGRLLLRRQGYPLFMEYILEACAKHDVTIELNANPNRLDIDWHWLPRMMEAGIKTSINPDAHAVAGFGDVRFGVDQARKGLVPASANLTSLPLDSLEAFFRERKETALSRV